MINFKMTNCQHTGNKWLEKKRFFACVYLMFKTLWSCLERVAVCFSLLSVKQRQCKFPLACILRRSWQDGVITEWLTHQHGKDLSPPGREIAKSQFTHIGLPVWAWSRSCKTGEPHTDTMTAHTSTCSKKKKEKKNLRRHADTKP